MFFMPLLGILLVGLIVWAVLAAVRRPAESGNSASPSEAPLDILKKRYARGEINKDEFEAKKKGPDAGMENETHLSQ
jgi:putative membrane protein